MQSGRKNLKNIKHNPEWRALLLVCVLMGGGAMPVFAADDLFDIEGGHWMSFAHYKDADKRVILPPDPVDTPATPPAAEVTIVNVKPTVAAPSRPIDLPVMPGLNKGFRFQVNSTIEDQTLGGNRQGNVENASPGSDKKWQIPTSIETVKKTKNDDSDEPEPLNVRLSYLPNPKIVPIASPDRESAQKAGHVALEKMLAARANPPKSPEETAACAAIDAYKKQQLAALQSDHATLKALQNAIHSLGLDKQLDFMQPDNKSVLSALGKQDTPTRLP